MVMTLFSGEKPIIAALHLPDFSLTRELPQSWFEDYAVTNARVFARAGIPWIKLQDQTKAVGCATPDTVARMAAIARIVRSEVPGPKLGIIVEAHDPITALSVASASGAEFVRLKVFVGGAMSAQGPRSGIGAEAVAHRVDINCPNIALLADVHDRTVVPISGETQPFAAEWAAKTGADGLVVTGRSFPDTLNRLVAVRSAGVRLPILIGGGVTSTNVAEALSASDGVVVSSALMRRNVELGNLLHWDPDLCSRFMEAARTPA